MHPRFYDYFQNLYLSLPITLVYSILQTSKPKIDNMQNFPEEYLIRFSSKVSDEIGCVVDMVDILHRDARADIAVDRIIYPNISVIMAGSPHVLVLIPANEETCNIFQKIAETVGVESSAYAKFTPEDFMGEYAHGLDKFSPKQWTPCELIKDCIVIRPIKNNN